MTIARRRIVTPSNELYPFPTAYLQTVFLVPEPPATWPGVFAIVTAHNPGGCPAPDAVNAQRQRALLEHLRASGIDSFEVLGCSPDLLHREPGRAFASDLRTACSISQKFEQQAFFWVEDGVVSICEDASGRGWEMALWQERLVGAR